MSIPVICDRCRSTGFAGEGDFSHLGDLLDFTPVPRKTKRADGWSPEKQRAFIAALSATGSKRQAAHAIGMGPYGVDQLLNADGSDSFKAAFERAMAIAAQHGTMKIAQGVADAAARSAVLAHGRSSPALTPPSRLRGLPLPAEEEASDVDEEEKLRLLEQLAARFMKKVAAERQARLGGEIVAADFYLRQITFLEVMFDLTATSFGWDPGDVLGDLRRGRHDIREIVSTPFADWLDTRRRIWWLREGEPERPPHPDARFIERHRTSAGECSTYVDQHTTGALSPPARGYSKDEWAAMNSTEQRAARQVQFDVDAEEQMEWERRAHEEWQASSRHPGLDPESPPS